jgi:hypothetical protein
MSDFCRLIPNTIIAKTGSVSAGYRNDFIRPRCRFLLSFRVGKSSLARLRVGIGQLAGLAGSPASLNGCTSKLRDGPQPCPWFPRTPNLPGANHKSPHFSLQASRHQCSDLLEGSEGQGRTLARASLLQKSNPPA